MSAMPPESTGVPQLILASSLQVVFGHRWDRIIKLEGGLRIYNHYALTKIWAEDIGETYGRVYGHSVIVVRPGWLPGSPPHAVQFMVSPVGRDVFLSHDDAGRFFRACVETEFEVGQFEMLFATSAARDKVHIDLEPAKPVVGFIPEDVWPEGIPFPVEERRDPGTIVLHYETQSTFFVCCASLSRHGAPSNLVSLKHRVAIAMKP